MQKQVLTILQQRGIMLKEFPDFGFAWQNGLASWRGWVQPTPLSERYELRVDYRVGQVPKVTVLSPDLEQRPGGDDLPHTYREGYLCLYLPRAKEWVASMSIATSIMRWALLWLYFYEIWLKTGTWEGGGEHPPKRRR